MRFDEQADYEIATDKLRISAKRMGADGNSIVHFNDTHTHAEVMAMFDGAIADAEAEGL